MRIKESLYANSPLTQDQRDEISEIIGLSEYQRQLIIEIAQLDFEAGLFTGKEFFLDDEEGDFVGVEKEAADFYEDLIGLGPAGMLEDYPELDWSDDFIAEYGDPDEELSDEELAMIDDSLDESKKMKEGRYGFGRGQIAPKGVELEAAKVLADPNGAYRPELDKLVDRRAAGVEFVPVLRSVIPSLKSDGAKAYVQNTLIPEISKLRRNDAGIMLWNSVLAGYGDRVLKNR